MTTPTARRITPTDQPVFPCWLWMSHGSYWFRIGTDHWEDMKDRLSGILAEGWTHWHPDQDAAPEQVKERVNHAALVGLHEPPVESLQFPLPKPTPQPAPDWAEEAAKELLEKEYFEFTDKQVAGYAAIILRHHAAAQGGGEKQETHAERFVSCCRNLTNGSRFDLTDSPLSFMDNVKTFLKEYDAARQQEGKK